MIHGTLLDDMNQSNDKIQRIDRSRAPVNVPQQSYGTRVNSPYTTAFERRTYALGNNFGYKIANMR